MLIVLEGSDLCELAIPAELTADDMAQGEDWPIGVVGLFFHGWNPLPTAASAKGGGDLLDSLLH